LFQGFPDNQRKAPDPFLDLLEGGVGEVDPHGIVFGIVEIEGRTGDVGYLLFDCLVEELVGVYGGGQGEPEKEAPFGLGP
jgi:hypothetical protein